MPIPAYTPGYPPDGSSLGQTKSTVRNNLDGTFETLNVDHVNNNGSPGSNPAGYHTIIHQVPQTSVSTVSGYNQVFCGVPGTLSVNSSTTPDIPPNGDTQLYSLTGMGTLAQLTGYKAATNGYVWIGGLLLQWGIVNGTHSGGTFSGGDTGSVSFNTSNVNFPNNCFAVWAHPFYKSGSAPASSSTATVAIASNFTTTAFNWFFATSSGSYTSFIWYALGN